MARKQSDYLADLLADEVIDEKTILRQMRKLRLQSGDVPAPVRPDRMRGSTLLGRESALARGGQREVRQVTQLLLDPARVRVWEG